MYLVICVHHYFRISTSSGYFHGVACSSELFLFFVSTYHLSLQLGLSPPAIGVYVYDSSIADFLGKMWNHDQFQIPCSLMKKQTSNLCLLHQQAGEKQAILAHLRTYCSNHLFELCHKASVSG